MKSHQSCVSQRLHLQRLERRVLLSHTGTEVGQFGAAAADDSLAFADLDGTQVVVRLLGGGTGAVYSDGQGMDLETRDTTPRSRLIIRAVGGGDGRATLRDVVVGGALRSLDAPETDVRGNVTVAGTVERIRVGDLSDGNADPNVVAPGRTLSIQGAGGPVALEAGVLEELDTVSASPFRTVRVRQWLDAGGPEHRVTAPWIGAITADTFWQGLSLHGTSPAGRTLGSVKAKHISGAWAVAGDAGPIRSVFASQWSASFGGRLESVTLTQPLPRRGPPFIVQRVDLAAPSIGRVFVRTNVLESRILGGANLGADGRHGGSGADADSFGPGEIGRVRLGGWIQRSVVAAGLNPVNGTLIDGDDVLVDGSSRIGAVTIGGGIVTGDVRIVAPELPNNVRVGRVRLRPADGSDLFGLTPILS